MIAELLRRLQYLFRRSRFDAELDAELEFHLESRAAELEAEGLAPAAARARARREFGSAAHSLEETRSAWQLRWLEDLLADLRYAARSFRRKPAFTSTAIACLALGIGVNTVIFSIAVEVLFSRPSVRDPATLMAARIGGNSSVPMDLFRFLRDAHIFEGVAGEQEEGPVNWREGEVTSRLFPVHVTDNFFAVTGIPLALGRPLRPNETDAVVLSYGLWQRRFGGDPNVIRRTMRLDGGLYAIAGVLPHDHRTVTGFGFAPDLYIPVNDANDARVSVGLFLRLPQGMTRATAAARVLATCRQYDEIQKADRRHRWAREVVVAPLTGMDRLRADSSLLSIAEFFAMLLVVVGLVLLIACANVASLLLARASSQAHEIAVRLSIGAGRGRLIRQLLAESLLLACCGTAAGLALNIALTTAISGTRFVLPIPFEFHVRPDERLLAYSIGLALVSCLAAGLAPALKATRTAAGAALKRGEHQVSGRWTLSNALVVGQLAVSIVLLCAGLLFVRNLVRASTASPGFDLQHTVWASMRLVPEQYANPNKMRAMADLALSQLRGLPGVDSASIARVVPLNNNMSMGVPVHTDLAPNNVRLFFRYNAVGPEYFRVMQIPILRGREFLPSDRRGGRRVAILNENMARRLFGEIDPIGHTVTWEGGTETVVGVARNSKYFTLGEDNMCAYYAPFVQTNLGDTLDFLLRAQGTPQPLAAPINALLGKLDATAAIDTKPMSEALVFALLPSRFGAAILGSVGVLGLTLAAIGLYGVLLYSVTRRIREIGLRMALGASSRDVLLMVLRESVSLAAAGIAIGIALGIFAVRPLAAFLTPEVRPTDPSTFVTVAALLLAVAVAATIPPALRALRVDPMVALRDE